MHKRAGGRDEPKAPPFRQAFATAGAEGMQGAAKSMILPVQSTCPCESRANNLFERRFSAVHAQRGL
jgi:hypothetical protein